MTRLINADAIPYVTDETYLHEFDYAYRYAIDALPTVEAIPIEWMLKWDDAPLTDESMKIGRSVKTKEIGRTVNWNTVKWMILAWRKDNG